MIFIDFLLTNRHSLLQRLGSEAEGLGLGLGGWWPGSLAASNWRLWTKSLALDVGLGLGAWGYKLRPRDRVGGLQAYASRPNPRVLRLRMQVWG